MATSMYVILTNKGILPLLHRHRSDFRLTLYTDYLGVQAATFLALLVQFRLCVNEFVHGIRALMLLPIDLSQDVAGHLGELPL